MRLVVGTGNAGKAREIGVFLRDLGVECLSLRDYPAFKSPGETGTTFEENALLKGRAVAGYTGEIALADDSGLCVDFLNGGPGVRSARYAGESATDEENNRLLLATLDGLPQPKRKARFVCVLALVLPGGEEKILRGEVEGRILERPRGSGGFGYDPLFWHEPSGKTFAQMSAGEKLEVSHRGEALRQLRKWLESRQWGD